MCEGWLKRGQMNSRSVERIAILAHGTRGAGATSVARNLVHSMLRQAPDIQFLVTHPAEKDYSDVFEGAENCTAVSQEQVGRIGRLLWESRTLPKVLANFRPDVLLGLGDRAMPAPPCPQAVLLHRPQMFYPPKFYGPQPLWRRVLFRYHTKHLQKNLKHVDLLLCQTEAARERVRATFGYQGPIELCPNAVSAFAMTSGTQPECPGPLRGLEDKMKLFCLTKYYPHKNLECIPRLLDRYADDLKDVTVVVTVPENQDKEAERFLRSLNAGPVRDHVVNVGYLDQKQLTGYFHHCQAMFLPTFLESFSGTYVEAMHFKTPILTSDLDFAHSVCGEAAVYFDPWSPKSIRDAIVRLRDTPGLADELVDAGNRRLKAMFRSWDDIAADLLVRLRQLAG